MSNIFDKLGVLFRSKVGGLADDIGSSLGVGVNRNQVVNSAVEYEGNIQKQIDSLVAEIADLNQQIDRAVEQGQDAKARHLITILQRREQHITLLQGDLETHQIMLNELILQVNQLDSVVADQNNRQESMPEAPTAPNTEELQNRVNKFQQVIDESQSKISELGEKIKSRHSDVVPQALNDAEQTEQSDDVDDELDQRRNRLMKR
jgi:phage shock protein A